MNNNDNTSGNRPFRPLDPNGAVNDNELGVRVITKFLSINKQLRDENTKLRCENTKLNSQIKRLKFEKVQLMIENKMLDIDKTKLEERYKGLTMYYKRLCKKLKTYEMLQVKKAPLMLIQFKLADI